MARWYEPPTTGKMTWGPGGFRSTACFVVLGATGAADKGVCPKDGDARLATAVGYTHGPPAGPENLAASLVPGGVALTWTVWDKVTDRASGINTVYG